MALSNEGLDIRPKTGSMDDNPSAPVYDSDRGGWYPTEKQEADK